MRGCVRTSPASHHPKVEAHSCASQTRSALNLPSSLRPGLPQRVLSFCSPGLVAVGDQPLEDCRVAFRAVQPKAFRCFKIKMKLFIL